jgi:subtilisin-like proprotein convertase family protein
MSVLYSLTLRRGCIHIKTKSNPSLRIFLLFIAIVSFQASFAQDEKEIQIRKEVELKKQEAVKLVEKLKANPVLIQKLRANELKELMDQLPEAEQKVISSAKSVLDADNEKARYEAKMLEQQKTGPSLPGVVYTIVTTGNLVEYVITNKGTEVFRQQVSIAGSPYDKKVQAEKEAIYAANILRANNNHPLDALRNEISALANAPKLTAARTQSTSRVTADYTFNGGGGTIPATGTSGLATPYPSIITASGVPAGAIVKEVTINGLNHTWADDVDIVLQSPTGVNVILVSDAGGSGDLVNHTYTFNDAASQTLADAAISPSGSYRPTDYDAGDNFPAPGPGTAASSVTLSTFGNGDQNGDWKLFVVDDLGSDAGSWVSWSITFTDPPPVCFPIVITGQPANAQVCSGANISFSVIAGPPGVSYNWQVDTGSGFVYLNNGGVYSGATTATLTITGATTAMNGYQYRVVVTCSQGGLPEISNPATLTVVTSPGSPVISPPSAAICPGGSVALNFVPNAVMQTATGTITIPTIASPASPYPSTLSVSGIPAGSIIKQVILTNFSHTWPSDVDIVLQSPTGTNVILLSDRGGSTPTVNATLTFDDAAAALVSSTAIVSGTFRPTNTAGPDAWPAPGPASFTQVNPTLATFTGNFNGTWNLFVNDQAGGDGGSITGWSIIFETPPGGPTSAIFSPQTGLFTDAGLTAAYTGTPVSTVYASPAATTIYSAVVNDGTCNSLPTPVTVTVNQVPGIAVQPGSGAACIGSVKTLSVTATGSGLTYQWQVDMGGGYTNIGAGTPTNPSAFLYTGQTTNTLSINTILATMNGYKYRVIVSGSCTPSVTSSEVILTVGSLPAISVTKSTACAPMTLTASGANTYSWSPSAGLSDTTGVTVTANPIANTIYTVTGTNTATGCTNTAQVDVKYTPAAPTVSPAAPIICQGTIQALSVSPPPPSVTSSSGPISVAVPDNSATGTSDTLNVAGFTGAVQSISVTFNITHTWDADLDINLVAPNGNILNLVYGRGGSGDNFTNTTISSASGTSLGTGAAPFTGTFAADGIIGAGPSAYLSNVSAFSNLFSVPNGTWRLAIADFGFGDLGTLTSWSITINAVTPPTDGVWSPVTGLFSDAAGTTPYVAGTPAATVYANPASTTTYSVTLTNSSIETRTFSTGGTVTIPGIAPVSTSAGAGAPYPSTVSVSGLPANAVLKSVTVKGVKHSFPDDIDMLLQSPTGTNVVLMSDVGGSSNATGQNYTFDDAAAALMADAALNSNGTYRPTNFGASDTYPAPIGLITQATPTLASFTGDPNGTWNLFINDGFAGDVGVISSWELTFTIPTAINCTSAPGTVTVTVHVPIAFTAQPVNRTGCQNSNVTFTAAATGTIQTTQWEVSTNGGTTWAAVTSGATGATTTTLTLTSVQPSMTGYRYRLALSNTGCGTVYSNVVTLTVNPKPTVSLTVTPAGQTQLRPGMQTTLTVNSAPAAASYQWLVNGVAQPQITGSSYVVDAYHLGTYRVRVTDVNGCDSITSGVTFTALPTSQLFIYPNPTSGAYYVTYYMRNPVPVTINIIDMKGRRIVQRQESTTAPYTRFDFTNDKLAAGVYVIEFRDPDENLLAAGRLVVTR